MVSTFPGRVTWRLLLLWLLAAILLGLILVPIGALIARGITESDILAELRSDMVLGAIALSLITSLIAVAAALVFGTPLAYALARFQFPGRQLLDTVVALPMVLPPIVGGFALLVALGRRGPVGGPLDAVGVDVAFTTSAVVLAQVFVAAPFYVRAAKAGFASVDPRLEGVSATLGARSWHTFRRVTVPLALPSLAGGAVMAWARGEFGATIMFAGNVAGRTQTMPLAILEALESDVDAAIAIAIILIAVAVAVLLTFKLLARRAGSPL